MSPRRLARLNGSRLTVAIALAFAAFFTLLIARGILQNNTNAAICKKVDKQNDALIAIVKGNGRNPRPGDYGYDYWLHHPGERANRPDLTRALALLREAACSPKHLPTGG